MDISAVVALLALGVSAIGFFYKVGRDTSKDGGADKMDQVLETVRTINKKLDDIADWQREAAGIHASHGEQIKTLFRKADAVEQRLDTIDRRLEDRAIVNEALKKILEKVG